MDLSNLLRLFLREVRKHPNRTAFLLNGEIVTNALFTQRIAPIMNELYTIHEHRIAVLMEQDLHNYAALPAALFTGKQIVPIKRCWSAQQRARVLNEAGIDTCLTAHRMQYYFRMTFEDALDRIDNGLVEEPIGPIASLYDFNSDDTFRVRDLFMNDIPENRNLVETVCDFFKIY